MYVSIIMSTLTVDKFSIKCRASVEKCVEQALNFSGIAMNEE